MKTLFAYRSIIRNNLLPFIGVCICIYFSYHAIYGSRSFVKWLELNQEIASLSQMHDTHESDHAALEKKVVMMRPGTLNRDLLEERARLVLGYRHPDELVMMRN